MITLFQRLCQFAEEFTEEYRGPLVEALTKVFREDLAEGEEAPDVDNMIRSLVRRLRSTFDRLIKTETELIVLSAGGALGLPLIFWLFRQLESDINALTELMASD